MVIGITYDLKQDYMALGFSAEEAAELDSPITINALEASLQRLGHTVVRIGHIHNLVKRLANSERWDLVFNITEGLFGIGREAQVPALLDAYSIPYTFSDPMLLALCLHKGMVKHVVRDLGIPTPAFFVVNTLTDVEQIKLPFPLFAKPVAGGTSQGVDGNSRVTSKAELKATCERLLEKFQQPVLVEEYLPGREVTVGITGTGKEAQVLGTLEIVLKAKAEDIGYSYQNKMNYKEVVEYKLIHDELAQQAERTALTVWKGLGARDAGRIDLRCDATGRVQFIEINPLAGLNPEDSDLPILCSRLGIGYHELIGRIVESASTRIATCNREKNPFAAVGGTANSSVKAN